MAKRFKDIIHNIDGCSPKDRLQKQVEALIAEVCFLEDVVIHLGAEKILEKHRQANNNIVSSGELKEQNIRR